MRSSQRGTKVQRRALELLAACRDGCTEAIMLAHGFTVEQMVELVRARARHGEGRARGRRRTHGRGRAGEENRSGAAALLMGG